MNELAEVLDLLHYVVVLGDFAVVVHKVDLGLGREGVLVGVEEVVWLDIEVLHRFLAELEPLRALLDFDWKWHGVSVLIWPHLMPVTWALSLLLDPDHVSQPFLAVSKVIAWHHQELSAVFVAVAEVA